MLQARHGPRLDVKTEPRLVRHRSEAKFDRYVALEQRVAREPDVTHPTAPERTFDVKLVDPRRWRPRLVHDRQRN
ncbi:MAG: hypothetical protein ACLQVI_21660, partial [Polyangiaceae bacterium]